MRSSSAGVLLIVLGALLLTGFLTGNLDRWLAYLFDPSRPSLSSMTGAAAPSGVTGASSGGGTSPASRPPSVG